MTWFRVDDGFPEHPKLEALEHNPRLWADALAVWIAAGCYCNRNLTDGAISLARLCRITPLGNRAGAVADELVKIGLWDEAPGGYVFHNWHRYQPRAVDVERKLEEGAERQRRSRERRRYVQHAVTDDVTRDSQRDVTRDIDVSHEAVTATHPIPSHPVNTAVVLRGGDSEDRSVTASQVGDAFEHTTGRPLGKWAPRYVELAPFSPYELKCASLAMERTCADGTSKPNPGLFLRKLEEQRRSPPRAVRGGAPVNGSRGYHPGSVHTEFGDVKL